MQADPEQPDAADDPWAEAEAAVRGEKPKRSPEPRAEDAAPATPAQEPAADEPDPWAEAEATVGGAGAAAPAAADTGGDADPWAEAEAAMGGGAAPADPPAEDPPADAAAPAEALGAGSDDPWAEAEAALGAGPAAAPDAAPAAPSGGDDPWAEAEAAVGGAAAAADPEAGSEPDAEPAAPAAPAAAAPEAAAPSDDPWAEAEAAAAAEGSAPAAAAEPSAGDAALAWAEAVKAAAARKQGASGPAGEAPEDDGAGAAGPAAEEPAQVDPPAAEVAHAPAADSPADEEPAAAQAGDEAAPEAEDQVEDDPAAAAAAEALVPEEPSQSVEPAELVPFGRDEQLDARVRSIAALLFASPEALGDGRLVELLDDTSRAEVRDGVAQLQARLHAAGLPFECRAVAGGWRLFTESALGEVVARLAKQRKAERLSQAGLETLAIIAYRQPVTKAEIEAIRGVQAGPMLRTLAERGLVRVAGRADQPGAPLLYATTKEFLDRFGLASLKDLPRDAELARD